MKPHYLLLLTFVIAVLSACNSDKKSNILTNDKIKDDSEMTISDEPKKTNASQASATLEMTIDGKNYNASCAEHYLNIAKEPVGGLTSYSLKMNFNYLIFSFHSETKKKLYFLYEIELNFKKSATDRKLKNSLQAWYSDENDKVVQTINDVGKVIITEMSEDKIRLEVDTKLLIPATMNSEGEADTVYLKGTVLSLNPKIRMMNGATKEEVF